LKIANLSIPPTTAKLDGYRKLRGRKNPQKRLFQLSNRRTRKINKRCERRESAKEKKERRKAISYTESPPCSLKATALSPASY
jgi:hypothetical protein